MYKIYMIYIESSNAENGISFYVIVLLLYVYIYIYTHIHTHTYIYMYMNTHIERQKEIGGLKEKQVEFRKRNLIMLIWRYLLHL